MQKTGYAFINMELTVHQPVFAGDTVHVECEVIESRLSASRPGRSLVRTSNKVVNQRGEVVLSYTPLRMVKCRNS
jgi:acyl dehydratase